MTFIPNYKILRRATIPILRSHYDALIARYEGGERRRPGETLAQFLSMTTVELEDFQKDRDFWASAPRATQ